MRTSLIAVGTLAFALIVGACSQPDDTGEQPNETDNALQLATTVKKRVKEEDSVAFVVKMDVAGQQLTVQGMNHFAGPDTAATATIEASGQKTEVRFVDQAQYVKLSKQMRQFQASDKRWIKLGGSERATQMLSGFVQLAEQGDPTRSLAQLEKTGTIMESRRVDINERAVTRYTIDMRIDKLADSLPFGLTKQHIDAVKKAGIDSYPAKLWIGDDDLPVKFMMDMSEVYGALTTGPEQPAQDGKSVLTVTYSDWGAPVDVSAPPTKKIGKLQQPNHPPQSETTKPGKSGTTDSQGSN